MWFRCLKFKSHVNVVHVAIPRCLLFPNFHNISVRISRNPNAAHLSERATSQSKIGLYFVSWHAGFQRAGIRPENGLVFGLAFPRCSFLDYALDLEHTNDQ
jgi:hypothetical protein